MKRIAIVDDHPVVIAGIRMVVDLRDDLCLAGTFHEGQALLDAMPDLKPDLIFLDIRLPDMSGNDLCQLIRKKYPLVKIIAFSVHNNRALILDMLQKGVNGYMLKNALADDILKAIYAVLDGQLFLCGDTQKALNDLESASVGQLPHVTHREKEVLRLAGQGLSTGQIADKLFISMHTVESHRKNLMVKFGVNNIAAVVKIATEHELI